MNVKHTLDGYWIIDGYIDREHEDAQAIMQKAKEQFIKANPSIDSSKVIVINGEFKQPTFKQPTLSDMAKTDESKSLTHDILEVMTNQANLKEMLGQS